MLKSPLRSGRNAHESTAENMKRKDSLKNVKTSALSLAENGIPEDDLKK